MAPAKILDPIDKGEIVNVDFSCPFSRTHRPPFKGEIDIAALVSGLGACCYPSTIVGRIWSVVIGSVDLKAGAI